MILVFTALGWALVAVVAVFGWGHGDHLEPDEAEHWARTTWPHEDIEA